MSTERERQRDREERRAYSANSKTIRLWHYSATIGDCVVRDSAIAITGRGALRVAEAEHPGCVAVITGCTDERFR